MGRTMRVLLMCSWGGHISEMNRLRGAWSKYDYRFLTYRNKRTEAMDEPKMLIRHPSDTVIGYSIDIMKTLFKLCLERPDVVISTGMGYVDIVIFPFCKFVRTKTVYIESSSNIAATSNTAKLVRKFSDHFLVQWPELAEEIGAEYHGGVL